MDNPSPSDIADNLRASTEDMASFAVVDMGLWNRHSNACLKAADEIERLRALTAPQLHQHGGGVEAVEDGRCPRPCNGRPDDFSMRQCIEAGECGCIAFPALAQQPLSVPDKLKHIAAEIQALKLHPATGEEYDAGYIAARNDAFAIVQEIIDNAQ